MRRAVFGLLSSLIGAVLVGESSRAATIQYDYSGLPLVHVQGGLTSGLTAVSGHIVLDTANTSDGVRTLMPLSWWFTDGNAVVHTANSFIINGGFRLTFLDGAITAATAEMIQDEVGPQYPDHKLIDVGDRDRSLYCTSSTCQGSSSISNYRSDAAGTWSPVPEPATAFLVCIGLLGFGFQGSRARRDE